MPDAPTKTPKTLKPHALPVTIKLTAYAMGQQPGSIMTIERHLAEALISRGAAEVVREPEPAGDHAPDSKARTAPPQHKAVTSAGRTKGAQAS